MTCPNCGREHLRPISANKNGVMVRDYKCWRCGYRFSTEEVVTVMEAPQPILLEVPDAR
jgi:transcriptional regulator NrdR family protein